MHDVTYFSALILSVWIRFVIKKYILLLLWPQSTVDLFRHNYPCNYHWSWYICVSYSLASYICNMLSALGNEYTIKRLIVISHDLLTGYHSGYWNMFLVVSRRHKRIILGLDKWATLWLLGNTCACLPSQSELLILAAGPHDWPIRSRHCLSLLP